MVILRIIENAKNLSPGPDLLIPTNDIFVELSTSRFELVTFTSTITGQQVAFPKRNEGLTGPTIRVSGEAVSEEPGTESHLGVFPQGGVQDLSTALFSWQ